MRYEYQVLMATSSMYKEQLDKFGLKGWELVTVVNWQDKLYFYFKRPVAQPSRREE